ncbi:MAG: NFACT family protein [Lachnospiraceae bacterium]|nr:NFACT family protein [Lachnospiraceae bacterium]
MAFDGITVAAVVKELSDATLNTRIYKISQPEADELLLTIKGNSTQFRVLISANASLPLIYKTDENKPSPVNAPTFCMLLRKHLSNAKIISVTQPGLERIVEFTLEHLDEMGDVCRKKLIVELMGKHSNIIFTDDKGIIIDSIKHISRNISSVREVLPGREYFIPKTDEKKEPLETDKETFEEMIKNAHLPLQKALYTNLTGFSPIMASEVSFRANLDSDASTSSLSDADLSNLYDAFFRIVKDIKEANFDFEVVYEGNTPKEYSCLPLTIYSNLRKQKYESISELLIAYYKEKSTVVRIRQKSTDLRKITQTIYERNVKKLDLQNKQLKDTEKKDKYRIYGELINTYGYNVPANASSFEALNYYTNETITIPLDKDLSAIENGKKYFEKYTKLKRTAESLTEIIKDVQEEVTHLESILTALDIAVDENDLTQIKQELMDSGYIKAKYTSKKEKVTSKPFHYKSSDGFDIYVGKNNYQNDWLTFDFANGNDWWFHAKKMPGSHVIVRTNGKEVPDRTFEEAAKLAAYYSKGRGSDRVEIDYLIKKNVKKPAKAKPGFVVYYTNYSMVIDDDIKNLELIKD